MADKYTLGKILLFTSFIDKQKQIHLSITLLVGNCSILFQCFDNWLFIQLNHFIRHVCINELKTNQWFDSRKDNLKKYLNL